MNKIFTFLIACSFFLFNSCSKDILKSYEDRILGTWQIDRVNKVGFGGDIEDLPFQEGNNFTFMENGALEFIGNNGEVYSGSWDMERAYYDDQQVRALHIAVVNFTTQQLRSELFEEIQFTGTNKFKGFIRQGLHTYVFHFER